MAILELLYSAAIRRSELTRLNLYDLSMEEQTVRVSGKGKKERMLPVGSAALYWLLKYIESVRKPRSAKEPALILDLVSRHWIRKYVKNSRLNKKVTPHTLRHSCATHLLKNGADIRYIQELLGHASVATTQIYTKVVITDLKTIFRKTHPRALKKRTGKEI